MTSPLAIALGALSFFAVSCQEGSKSTQKPPAPEIKKKKEEAPAKQKSLLNVPAGAVISDLTLPYFNKNKEKVSLLTIASLVVEDGFTADEIILSAKTLKLWLFDREGAIRSTTTIPSAIYEVETETLRAGGEILMVGSQNQFAAKSTGGTFSLATGQAFLFGPTTTRFESSPNKKDPTAMKLRPLLPLGAVPLLIAAPPAEVTPEQLADFERKVAPRIIPHIDGEKTFAEGQELNRKVDDRLADYLGTIGQTSLISQTAPLVAAEEDEDPLKDLFEPGPRSIVIECSKGLYLDGENREIVYLGEIKIEGRGITMTCQRDLKALFDPPPAPPEEKEAAAEKDEKPMTKFGGFGDLKQLTATGKVRINGVNEKGQKVYLGGDRALYEMEKEGEKMKVTVTMRGDDLGFILGDPNDPANKEGTAAIKSISPDAWIVATLIDEAIRVRTSENGWISFIARPE